MKVVACPTELLQILRENTCFVTAPFFVSLTLCMMLWPQNQERGTARTRLVYLVTQHDDPCYSKQQRNIVQQCTKTCLDEQGG